MPSLARRAQMRARSSDRGAPHMCERSLQSAVELGDSRGCSSLHAALCAGRLGQRSFCAGRYAGVAGTSPHAFLDLLQHTLGLTNNVSGSDAAFFCSAKRLHTRLVPTAPAVERLPRPRREAPQPRPQAAASWPPRTVLQVHVRGRAAAPHIILKIGALVERTAATVAARVAASLFVTLTWERLHRWRRRPRAGDHGARALPCLRSCLRYIANCTLRPCWVVPMGRCLLRGIELGASACSPFTTSSSRDCAARGG